MKDLSDKKIVIIGDLHLTDKDSKIVKKSLNLLKRKYDLVIINGDLSDKLFCRFTDWFNTWGDEFKDNKYLLIRGNHDFQEIEMKDFFQFIYNGKRYDVRHGYKVNRLPHFIKIYISIFDRFICCFGKNLPDCIYKFFNKTQKQSLIKGFINVRSHTHCYEVSSNYINTGVFVCGNRIIGHKIRKWKVL